MSKEEQKDKKNWQEIAEQELEATTDNEEGDEEKQDVLEHPGYKELEDKLTKAEAKAHEYWDKFMRLQAELDNIQRRSARELEKAHKFALENFVNSLLPVVDSLEKGVDACSQAKESVVAVKDGIEMTHKMFISVLKKFAVEQIDPIGEPFDPSKHEAISTESNSEVDPNTVIRVFQKGFLLNGRLIRPALVVVSKA